MSDIYLEHLAETNRIFADQIKTADQKSAYVFTFMLAVLAWSSEVRQAFSWTHFSQADPAIMIVSAVLVSAIVVCLASAVLVVLPRSRPGKSLFFWGAWPGVADRLVAARNGEDGDFLFAEYLQNTRTLAAICQTKYRLVAFSLRALLCTVVAYAGLLFLLQ